MSQRAAVSSAALGLVALAASLALLALPACDECDSSIDPVKCTDLCEQDPPHRDCAQCTGATLAENCPQCQEDPKPPGCSNGGDGGAGTLSGSGGIGGGGAGGAGGMSGQGGSGGVGGVVGGMGGNSGEAGDAGMNPPSCEDHTECVDYRAPFCGLDGECAPCDDNAPCVGRETRNLCDTGDTQDLRGACVQCIDSDDCTSNATPHCVTGLCEECADDGDCDDPSFPQCNVDYECVACDQATCDDRAPGTHCDTRPANETETEGQCVQCLTDDDCDNPTPQCNSAGSCETCTGDAACTGRTDGETALGKCNTRVGLETTGQCVHCTADNEADATGCGENACNQDLGTCTSRVRGAIKNPCVACVADSECDTGMSCVRHVHNGQDLGAFCFYAKSTNDGCSDTRSAVRPFSITATLASLDATAVDYCLPPTSCAAYQDTIAGSGGKSCESTEDCGVGDSAIDNALCIGAAPNGRCTYICNADNQCPTTDQSDCSGAPGHCRP